MSIKLFAIIASQTNQVQNCIACGKTADALEHLKFAENAIRYHDSKLCHDRYDELDMLYRNYQWAKALEMERAFNELIVATEAQSEQRQDICNDLLTALQQIADIATSAPQGSLEHRSELLRSVRDIAFTTINKLG